MKNKAVETCRDAMKTVLVSIHELGHMLPQRIDSDNESAFMSARFQDLLQKWEIEHHPNEVGDHRKLAYVDRVTRTLRSLFNKARILYGSAWINQLPDLISSYNQKMHSQVGSTPTALSSYAQHNTDQQNDRDKVLQQISNIRSRKRTKARGVKRNRMNLNIQPGEEILVRKPFAMFRKGTEAQYDPSLRRVEGVKAGRYQVNGDRRTYRPSEVLRIRNTSNYKDAMRDRQGILRQIAQDEADRRAEMIRSREGIDLSNIIPAPSQGIVGSESVQEPARRASSRTAARAAMDNMAMLRATYGSLS
jgi:hypothetical protein